MTEDFSSGVRIMQNGTDILAEVVSRDKVIIKTSVIGIATNVLLAAFKAVIGILSHSIAVTLDAVNNLSDALSSIITIVGTRLANRLPDKKHPLGYGRIEYLSALIVAGIVLYAGITAGIESVKKIIHPETSVYSVISQVIIAVAVAVKIVLGRFVKAQGEKVNSGSLVASGSDAMFDAILSASVLVCAIISSPEIMNTGLSLEAYVGVLIAVFIVRSGIEMMRETLDELLGMRTDTETAAQIKRMLNEEEAVHGAYDLITYNFGPDRNYATVHLELPDTMTAGEIDTLTRRVASKVYRETGVLLTGVGVYALNTGDDEAARIREDVSQKVLAHDWALQIHGFFVDTETRTMRFDAVLSFDIKPRDGLATLHQELEKAYPGYAIQIVPDVDVSD